MKKLVTFLLIFSSYSQSLHSQSTDSLIFDNTFGIRFNFGSTYGIDLATQLKLHKKNQRLDISLGNYGFTEATNRISGIGTYEWMWGMGKNLHCYTGPNLSLTVYTSSNQQNFGIGAGGIGGLEYIFNPFIISAEFRPIWYTIGDVNGLEYFFAFGLRLTF